MKNQFKEASKNLKKQMVENDELYMADKNNWLLVHCTHYMPQKNENDELVIQSTAGATGGDIPRATVHFTFNHTVAANNGGSWTDKEIVVLSPYVSTVEKNNKPAVFYVQDTFFSVSPDKGLVLPENARIVKPLNDGPLYQIGENVSIYKTDNFTDDEIELIKSWMPEDLLMNYDKYNKADFTDIDLSIEKRMWPEKIVKVYEMAKDKRAFLKGFYEEQKYEILNSVLRDKVVEETAKKMGYRTISRNEENFWPVDNKISSIALQDGILFCGLHDNSLYGHLESIVEDLNALVTDLAYVKNIDQVIQTLFVDYPTNRFVCGLILTNEKDFKKALEHEYEKWFSYDVERLQKAHKVELANKNKLSKEQYKSVAFQYRYLSEILKQPFGKRVLGFDKNLYKTLQKNSDVMAKKIEKTFNVLDKKFGMKEIKKYLNTKMYSEVEKSW